MFLKSLYLQRLEERARNKEKDQSKTLFRTFLNKRHMTCRYEAIDSALFKLNRYKLAQDLNTNSLAIFHSNDEMPRNGDCFYPYRQNSDLFYLCGIDQEQTVLVLYPDCPNPSYREVLFIRKTDEHIKIWEGHKYDKTEASHISGIKTVLWLENFDNIFQMMANWCDTIYVNTNENDRAHSEVPTKDLRFARYLRDQFPAHKFERSAPLVTRLRERKSEIEIELIRKACGITENAFRRVLDFMKPGVFEYEVEAEIIHEFVRNRSNGHAYQPIVASGLNACILHYTDNNQECKDGDLVLMDFGAEYANYASDLTRTIPVNGKFTKRQLEVYNSVLHVMDEAKKMLVEGVILGDYHKAVGKIMEEELVKLGLLSMDDLKKQNPQNPAYKKYFMHGTSHFLGLDVHDVGNRHKSLSEGMVLTVEPGIYIPEEKIGIRLENDVVITKNSPIDLMESIPLHPQEIEDLMNK